MNNYISFKKVIYTQNSSFLNYFTPFSLLSTCLSLFISIVTVVEILYNGVLIAHIFLIGH